MRGVDDSHSHIHVPCGTQTHKQIRIRTHVPHIRTSHHKLDPEVENTRLTILGNKLKVKYVS